MRSIVVFVLAVAIGAGACTERPVLSSVVEEVTTLTEVCAGDCIRGWFSPDGTVVAYTGAKYRGLVLYTLGDRRRTVVSDSVGAGFFPVWSPDGSRIAFRERSGSLLGERFRIVTVSREGTSRQVIADDLEEDVPLSWHGTLMAVSRATLRPIIFHDAAPIHAARTLRPLVVGTEDGVKVIDTGGKVTALPARSHSPRLSPDGGMVAYLRGNEVRIYRIETGEDREIAEGSHPAWMPDGKGLLVAVTEDDGREITASRLYLVSLDGTQRLVRTAPGAIPIYPDAAEKRILYTDHASDRILVHTLELE